MNSKIKSFLCVLFCFALLFTISPLQSFAASNEVTFNYPEPFVDSNNCYLAYKNSEGDSGLYQFKFYPSLNNQSNNDIHDISIAITGYTSNSSGTYLNYTILSSNWLTYYFVVSYTEPSGLTQYFPIQSYYGSESGSIFISSNRNGLVNLSLKGNIFIEGDSGVPIVYPLIINWANDTDYHTELNEVIEWLITNHSDNLNLMNQFVSAINNLYTQLHSDNVELLGKLTEVLTGVVQLHSDNVELLSEFAKLLADTKSIRNNVDIIVNYIYDSLDWHLFEIQYYLMDTLDKLDVIIDLLQPDTDVNVSKVDPSNFNEYNKAEQDLINNDGVDVTGAMNVEINQQALTYIWPLVERCLNANPKVIGLTFTILAVSLVALILGRKGG